MTEVFEGFAMIRFASLLSKSLPEVLRKVMVQKLSWLMQSLMMLSHLRAREWKLPALVRSALPSCRLLSID